MDLNQLGWNPELNRQFAPHYERGLIPARVAVEDKHFFRVWTADAEFLAQVTGKCIHEARQSDSRLPKVGDWVAVKLVPNEEKAMIQASLPRRTQLSRKMTGRDAAEQILAANIETVFLVTAADPSKRALHVPVQCIQERSLNPGQLVPKSFLRGNVAILCVDGILAGRGRIGPSRGNPQARRRSCEFPSLIRA